MQRTLKIKQLDLHQIRPRTSAEDETGSKIVIIGKPGSGKSFLIRDLIHAKRHIFPVAEVVSGTEDSNAFFSKMFPSIAVHEQLTIPIIQGFIRRQKIAKKHLPRWAWGLLVLDDCMDDPALFRDTVFKGLLKNGRHWKLLFILGMQYAVDILPALRVCVDGTFIFREPSPKIRKVLFDNYAGVLQDFKLFCKVMDEITDDNTALYIDNRIQSNNVEDCVYWYKAADHDDFKFGCDDYWLFHEQRFDAEHKDTF